MLHPAMLSGLTAEALAGILLWLSAGAWAGTGAVTWAVTGAVSGAVILHTLSSWLCAQGFWQQLPRRYKLPLRSSMGFLFLILWLLPVLGVLGISWSITGALKRPRSRSLQDIQTVVLPELPFSPPLVFPVPPYSQGALRQIVYFAERPLKRLKAVMATRYMPPREAVAIWSKASRDPVDDVRLLAYAMKDENEKILAERILALTETLPDMPVHMQNSYHKSIAALCWELVYHRLAQGALRTHWLKTARHHLEFIVSPPTSAALGSADPDSWLLYGRILLETGELESAKAAFGNARAGGIDEQKILPWLAEIAFEERKFDDVRRYLSALSRPGEKGRGLAQVKAWWTR
ncbi:MAG: protein PelE [Betaproteobacteria bacterium]|nr:protein PelE [Betaproteobacteria bacterium]